MRQNVEGPQIGHPDCPGGPQVKTRNWNCCLYQFIFNATWVLQQAEIPEVYVLHCKSLFLIYA